MLEQERVSLEEASKPEYYSKRTPEKETASFTDFYQFNTAVGNIAQGVASSFAKDVYEPDDEFEWDEERNSLYYEGITNQEDKLFLAKARSDKEAQWRRDLIFKRNNAEERIQNTGLTDSVLLGGGAVLADPSAYLLGIGYGAVRGHLQTFGRIAAAGIEGAAYEMPAYVVNPNRTEADVAFGALFGLAFQGIGEGAHKAFFQNRVNNTLNQVQANIEKEASAGVDSVGAARVQGTDVEDYNFASDSALNDIGVRLSDLDTDPETGAPLQQGRVAEFIKKADVTLNGRLTRYGMQGSTVSDWLSKDIVSDATGINTRGVTAADEKRVLDYQYTENLIDYNKVRDNWTELQSGDTLYTKMRNKVRVGNVQEFDDAVYEYGNRVYLANKQGATPEDIAKIRDEYDDEVLQAMDILNQNNQRILADAKDSGVHGFAKVEHTEGYIPRMLNQTAVENNIKHHKQFGELYGENFYRIASSAREVRIATAKQTLQETEEKLNTALKEGQNLNDLTKIRLDIQSQKQQLSELSSAVDKDKYLKQGANFFNSIVKRQIGYSSDIDTLFKIADQETLTSLLGDAKAAEELMTDIKAMGEELSRSGRSKYRIDFDMNSEMTAPDGTVLRLSDIYERDISKIMTSYGQELAGRVALARKGLPSVETDFASLANLAMGEVAGNMSSKKKGKMFQDILDTGSMFLNRPIKDAAGAISRRAGEITEVTLLDKTGIAQTADLALAMGHVGALNVLREMPGFRSLLNSISQNKASEELLAEIQTMVGAVGKDHLIHTGHLSRIGETVEGPAGAMGRGLDNALGFMRQHTYNLNLMNPIKSIQQKATAIAAARYVVDSILNNKHSDRLATMGVDKDLIKGIKKEFEAGNILVDKGRLNALNSHEWTSKRQQAKFSIVIRKAIDTAVQEGTIGEGVPFMSKAAGIWLGKLQNFAILATYKQLARNVHIRDAQSAGTALYATLLSAMVYAANDAINNAGKDEPFDFDDYTRRVALGSVMYNPMLGWLPEGINYLSVLPILPDELTPRGALFGREGVSGDSLTEKLMALSAPAGAINNLAALPTYLMKAAWEEDTELTQEDFVKHFQKSMWMGNSVWLGPVLNKLKEE